MCGGKECIRETELMMQKDKLVLAEIIHFFPLTNNFLSLFMSKVFCQTQRYNKEYIALKFCQVSRNWDCMLLTILQDGRSLEDYLFWQFSVVSPGFCSHDVKYRNIYCLLEAGHICHAGRDQISQLIPVGDNPLNCTWKGACRQAFVSALETKPWL